MSPILGHEDRRLVTVVFADIVGFTALSERLDPEVVRDVTAACFGRLVEEIVQRGGTVDKFIGDAVMALFGTPVAHENDPTRAVDAALAMQAALGEINGSLERDHGLRLELRIGVDTGQVVAGVRQVGGLRDSTVIGDAVNTAARLQTAAAPGTVLVGGPTARLVEGFELEAVEPLVLRGKAEPVEAFRALGKLEAAAVADVEAIPLVGRGDELGVLRERVERLAAGEGQVVVVLGDPGIGKSRLLGELRRTVGADPRLRWAEAHAAPYGPGHGFRMYGAALREALEADRWAPEAMDDELRARLDQLGVPEALPFARTTLGLADEATVRAELGGLAKEEIARRARRAMQRLMVAMAEERPYVLAIDDLQWADPAVVESLEGWLGLTTRAPILLCLVFRPDRDAPCWTLRERAEREVRERYTEIRLGPLRDRQMRELIRRLLLVPDPSSAEGEVGARPESGSRPGRRRRSPSLGRRAEARLLARSEGNPLYAHEVVRTLVERGALARRDGRWDLDPEATLRVPETLQATILARIDRLPEGARHVVQTGAVLGRAFSHQVLARVVDDASELERGLREVQRAGLLREQDFGGVRGYMFAQALVREVAEGMLLVRRRKELHQAAFQAMVALYADDLSPHAAGLARHAFEGELWEPAIEHGRVAAEHAAANYANRDAARFYGIALAAAGRQGRAPELTVVRLLAGRAEVLSRLGAIEEAAVVLAEALERASGADLLGDEREDPPRLRARLALELAQARIALADVDATDVALGVARANLHAGQPELAVAWSIESWVRIQRNDLAGSAEAARQALAVALEHGGFEERAEAYGALTKPGLAGEIGPSIESYAREAVRLAREHQHDGRLFDALVRLEVLRQICLQPHNEEAVANAAEAIELARKMDSLPAERTARVALGATLMAAGRWDEAARELQGGELEGPLPIVDAMRTLLLAILWTARGRLTEARELLEQGLESGAFPHAGVWCNVALAQNQHLAGDEVAARAALTAAEVALSSLSCLACEAMLSGYGGELLAERGDERAADLATRALAAGGGAFTIAVMLAHRTRSLLAARAGDWCSALDEAEAALRLSDEVGRPYERARTLRALATARAGVGGPDAARAASGEALATFDRLGAAPEAAQARAQLDTLSAGRPVSA